MKTIRNFAAQQLSKKRMNEVKGGRKCTAVLKTSKETVSVEVPNGHVMTYIIIAGMDIEARYGDIATIINCRFPLRERGSGPIRPHPVHSVRSKYCKILKL